MKHLILLMVMLLLPLMVAEATPYDHDEQHAQTFSPDFSPGVEVCATFATSIHTHSYAVGALRCVQATNTCADTTWVKSLPVSRIPQTEPLKLTSPYTGSVQHYHVL